MIGPDIEESVGPAETDTIRVLIADAHPIVREGLRRLFALEDDLRLIGEVGDGDTLLEAVQQQEPDLVLLEIRMPGMDWRAVLQRLRQFNKESKVLLLTESNDRNDFVEAIRLGCSGVLLKDVATGLIIKSIRKVHAGEIWLDSATTRAVMGQFSSGPKARSDVDTHDQSPLSPRERELATLVAQGYKNREISEKLFHQRADRQESSTQHLR
jgi:two-component system nitrate/nitrite response regulator NarL